MSFPISREAWEEWQEINRRRKEKAAANPIVYAGHEVWERRLSTAQADLVQGLVNGSPSEIVKARDKISRCEKWLKEHSF